MVKYADDTTVCGLIKNDETSYRNEVQSIVNWCTENDLELNINPTQEFVIDFRKNPAAIAPLVINGSEVEIVKCLKFLGVHLSSDLKWGCNADSITKKGQQRLFFLRSFHVSQPLLLKFYRAVIESVLTQSQ